jgi:4-amino-4-deoxy-L-arabinose transferase-like glycosyltransferase
MNTAAQPARPAGTNKVLWLGVLVMVLALASFFLFFIPVAGQRTFPWLNLGLSALALLLVVTGLRRAISQPLAYRGKLAGWVFTVLAMLLLAFGAFAFYVARDLPRPNRAPAVGQKAPDFQLRDSSGATVALAGLYARNSVSGNSEQNKAVLLVFYRGYW